MSKKLHRPGGAILASLLVAGCYLNVAAQSGLPAGSLDPSFNADLRALGYVYALARQTNGSVIVGGWFQALNGVTRNNLGRLDAAGNLDPGFSPRVNGAVRALAVQPNGKVLIGGEFTAVNGTNASHLARLTPAGDLDPDFQFGTGADGTVRAVMRQPDGRILVGGTFGHVQGTAHPGLVRLLANGSLDTTFQPGLAAGEQIYAVELQPDSQILIGGWFDGVSGAPKRGIARLNAAGALDDSFSANIGPNDWVDTLKVLPDGHILVGGSLCEINRVSRSQLARLHPDGSVDRSFAPGARVNGEVMALGWDAQGRVIAAGTFDEANSAASRGIARFQPDGTLDQSLRMDRGVNGIVYTLCAWDSGSWLAGGRFDDVSGLSCASLARVQPDGTPDVSFAASTSGFPEVWCLAVESDGRLLLGGRFNQVDGVRRNGIARLTVNGQLDASFDPGTGIDQTVFCLRRGADGLVWAGGCFNLVDGHPQHSVACLSSEGTALTGFKPFEWLSYAYTVLPLPDGTVLAGGNFWEAGSRYNCIARLKSGGGLDLNLPLGWGANNNVRALFSLPDGRILMGGRFTGVGGYWRKGIARLKPDGSLDSGFRLDLGANADVFCLRSYPGSKVLVGGVFNAYHTAGLLRLAPDGSVDSTFSTGAGPDGWIADVAVQSNSKILAGGYFTHFNGASAPMITPLNANGSEDPNFNVPPDINGSVTAVRIQPGGGIVVGGRFNRLGGRGCTGLARLNPGT